MVASSPSRNKSHGHLAGASILLALVVILSVFAGGLQNFENQVPAEAHISGHLNPPENVSSLSGQDESNGMTVQSSIATSKDPYAGYVQYTLFPNNNTLMNGNIAGNASGIPLNGSGARPYALEYDPINNLLYVSYFLSGEISVVEPISNRIIFNISGFHFPTAFALDKVDNYLYVANMESNYVSVINASSNSYVGNISVPSGQAGIAFDPETGYLYVSDYQSGSVSVIDASTDTIVSNLSVGEFPYSVCYDPSNGFVYVGHYVPVLVSLSGSATSETMNSASTSSYNSSDIVVIDPFTDQVVSTIGVGSDISDIEFDSSNGDLYAANAVSPYIVGISSASDDIISNVTLGFYPNHIAFNPSTGLIYVTPLIESEIITSPPPKFDNVTVMNSSLGSEVSQLEVGWGTEWIVFDALNSCFYSANSGSGTISIISTQRSYTASFNVSGIPRGFGWFVNVTGIPSSGRILGNSYSLDLPNGTYDFAVASSNKSYKPDPCSGSFSIDGSSVSLSVAFSEVLFQVFFNEEGLPSGMRWTVIFSGSSNSSASSTIGFEEPNGTFNYSILTVQGFHPTQSYGKVRVDGKSVTELVLFKITVFSVMFAESGLPSGTVWSVTLNGTSLSSNTTSISFTVPNGTYSYSVGYIPGYRTSNTSGAAVVNGSSIIVSMNFTVTDYPLTVVASGLPNGTNWYVTLAQSFNHRTFLKDISPNSSYETISPNSSEFTFLIPNGTYAFSITWNIWPAPYLPSITHGFLRVNGSGVKEILNFSRAYLLLFNESGLPIFTVPNIAIENNSDFYLYPNPFYQSLFLVLNGTYSYSIGSTGGFYPSPSNGTISVNGSNVFLSVEFYKPGYFIGKMNTVNATLTINGSSYKITNGEFNISLSPGTYEVKVSAPGYSPYMTNVTISSSSVSKLQIQSLTSVTTPSSFSFLLIVVIVVIAAIASAVFLLTVRNRKGKS